MATWLRSPHPSPQPPPLARTEPLPTLGEGNRSPRQPFPGPSLHTRGRGSGSEGRRRGEEMRLTSLSENHWSRTTRRILTALLLTLEGSLTLATGYLLILLGAAAKRRRASPPLPPAGDNLRFIILIPAYNEELGIKETLASLQCLDYPDEYVEIVVIADNCRDRTAELARAAGAAVYERTDSHRRGKGHALTWALDRAQRDRPEAEAMLVLDADCQVSPNLLTALDTRLRAGDEAVQANYLVANPGESWSSGLRFAAFSLINTVRPLGLSGMRLSCGLLGTGMGFRRSLLEEVPWDAVSLAEDGEYHCRLVETDRRVVFAPEAWVSSSMPTSLSQAREQQLRWEGGRWELIRTWTPRLALAGLRGRNPLLLHTALVPLVPPQTLHLAANIGAALLAIVLRSRSGTRLAAANLIGQACYIIGGLLLVRSPASAYRALAMSPILIAWKLWLYARIVAGRSPKSWVRTERTSVSTPPH